ncbi:helix-turn-helix domain-containing protein [Microbacterium kribbense]|uniref:Helix-turn-helix domain-containing protein n=1 Tax=Microbacterium kribbense TaxID=433645 RepID=A0ABP7GYW9_9MICO
MLRLLDESEHPQTVASMSEQLCMPPNTVRFHLDRLLGEGLVERTMAARGTPGRPAQLFRRVRKMDGAASRRYRILAEVLVEELAVAPEPAKAALEAGRRWGRREAEAVQTDKPAEALVDLLDRVGFKPRRGDDPDRVGVFHCPFLELAQRAPKIVCSIHLGMMQGALTQWGADTAVTDLERREQPDECVVHLGPVADGARELD